MRSFVVLLTVTLGIALVGCGDDDGPTTPDELGSSSNPEQVNVGTPTTGGVPASGTYYLAFETSTSGDYIPSLSADQPLAWALYQDPSGKMKVPEDWVAIGDCGVVKRGGSTTCTMTGLDSATEYILELSNLGSAESTYTLTVSQGMGVGSVNDPVEETGAFADCTDSFLGQVGTRFSYYKITDLARSGANAPYIFVSEGDDADFYFYSDPNFSTLLASATSANSPYRDAIVPVPEGGVFYLRVDGSNTAAGTTFSFECD